MFLSWHVFLYVYYAPQKVWGEHIVAALSVPTSVCRSGIFFAAITLLFVVGLKSCLAQMIVIRRRHDARNIPGVTFKVRVTGRF